MGVVLKRVCPYCEREIRVRKDGALAAHGRGCVGALALAHESKEDKAARYLAEGRVGDLRQVEQARWGSLGDRFVADVRGEGDDYRVEVDGVLAACTCPSTRTCAHILAVRLKMAG